MAVGICFLLRASELVPLGCTSTHWLRRQDVSFGHDVDGLLMFVQITIRSSKCSSIPVVRRLACPPNELSAGLLLEVYMQCTKTGASASDPVFPGVSRQDLSKIVSSSAVLLGYHGQEHDFASHSLRRGGTVSLIDAGASRDLIKCFGRWATDVWEEVYAILSFEKQMQVSFFFSSPTSPRDLDVGDPWSVAGVP